MYTYYISKKIVKEKNKLMNAFFHENMSSSDDIFKMIYENVSLTTKFQLLKCIDQAILKKNKKLVEFLLKEKAPCKDALIEAVSTHDLEMVDLVLKYNSEPSFVNQNQQRNAFSEACINNDLAIVKRLLSVPGIDPSLYENKDQTPLICSIVNLNYDIMCEILNFYGDDIQSHMCLLLNFAKSFFQKYTTRNRKIADNGWKIIKRLTEIKCFDINFCKNQQNHTFLYLACFENKIDVVELLLKSENINVNLYDSNSYYTPLMISLEKKNIKVAKLLINHPKTNINLRNICEESALTIAVRKEEKEIIEILIKDQRFDPIESRLILSFIYSNNDEIIDYLYSLEFLDVNETYDNTLQRTKMNALQHSVEINDIAKIEKIINHPSFNIYKSQIHQAIFISAKNNNIEVFQKLIKLINNNINIYNRKHISLISYASLNLSGEIIDEILSGSWTNSVHFE